MADKFLIFLLFTFLSLSSFAFDLTGTGEQQIIYETGINKNMAFGNNGYIDFKNISLPQSGWIVGIASEIVGGEKSNLHHLHLFNEAKTDLTCPSMEERIFAAGPETTGNDFPAFFGYRVTKDQTLRLTAHLNNSQRSVENLKLRLKIKFQPDSAVSGKIDLQPLFLDSVDCSYDPSFVVYPGRKDYLPESTYTASQSRRVAFVGGHLHDYSERLAVKVNGEDFWLALPKTDDNRKIIRMPVGVYYGAKKINKGDNIWVESTYNNTENKLADGMGIAVVYLIK